MYLQLTCSFLISQFENVHVTSEFVLTNINISLSTDVCWLLKQLVTDYITVIYIQIEVNGRSSSFLTDLSFFSFLQGDNQVHLVKHLDFGITSQQYAYVSVLIFALLCSVSITTWWWLQQQLLQPQPQRTTTCCSTVSCPTAPLRCYGSSRAPPGAAHWQPPTEAVTVAAPVVWCLPAVCETATKTESETETGTATPSQDCQGPQWKLQRRQPFMAPYLTLSLLTRPTENWKTRETSRTGVRCK